MTKNQTQNTRVGNMVIQTGAVEFEDQTEGGMATSTPKEFSLPDVKLLGKEQAFATIKLYKVRLISSLSIYLMTVSLTPYLQDMAEENERKYEEIVLKLHDSMEVEKQLRQR